MEEEIRGQKEFIEMLIDSSLDGILAYDREYRYTLWNPAMERLSGMPAAAVLGRSALELFGFLGFRCRNLR